MIIAIAGRVTDRNGKMGSAGAGKDTAAGVFETIGYQRIGFADRGKRFIEEVFGIKEVWGESKERDRPLEALGGKSARDALKALLSGWGRALNIDVWTQYAIKTAKCICDEKQVYSPHLGIGMDRRQRPGMMGDVMGAVFTDVRFDREFVQLKEAGALMILVKRSVDELFADPNHESENGLNHLKDEDFNIVIEGRNNDVPGLQDLTEYAFLKWIDAKGRFDNRKGLQPRFIRVWFDRVNGLKQFRLDFVTQEETCENA